MSATFFLPPEIRTKVYNFALADTTITITLRCVKVKLLDLTGEASIDAFYFCIPPEPKLKAQLCSQKNVISPLYTSRCVYGDLSNTIYSHIRLHFQLPSADHPEISTMPAADYTFLRSLYDSSRLRSLLNRIGAISSPIELRKAWKSALTYRQIPFDGLQSLILFDNKSMRACAWDPRSSETQTALTKREKVARKAARQRQTEYDQAISLRKIKIQILLFGLDGVCESILSNANHKLSCEFVEKVNALLNWKDLAYTPPKCQIDPFHRDSGGPCSCCKAKDSDWSPLEEG